MTPEKAFKLRAGDFVTDTTRPGNVGLVKARRGHLLYISWGENQDQFILTYDAQNLAPLEDATR